MVTVPSLVDETPLDQYTATGGQTDFNFTYMIFATADIKVYVNGTLKTETTDYVVKQSDGSAIVPADDLPMDGGKVVFNSGLTANDEVSLSRDIAIERLTGYSVAGAFRADVVNAEFTKRYAVQQQLERDLARSVRLSASDSEGGSLELPSNRANNYLAFDASGNMIASAGSTDSNVVSSFMATVLDDTTAAAARTTLGAQAQDDDLDDIAALTVARGDILIGNSTPEWSNLAKGSANYLLKSDGTDLSWGFEVLDEDDMSSDSDTKLASQQSIKAYVDSAKKVFSVGKSATQSLSTNVFTKIQFDSKDSDPDSEYDNTTNYRYTPQKAGWYLFICGIQIQFLNDQNAMEILLYLNGSAVASSYVRVSGNVTSQILQVSKLINMNGSSDYVEGYAIHSYGSNRDVSSGFLQGIYLGD